MAKVASLIILLFISFSASANNTSQIMCSFLSSQSELIATEVEKGKDINSVQAYQELLDVFSEGGPFFQSEIKGFLAITPNLPPNYIGAYFAHACVNNYISEKNIIAKLSPIIKDTCVSEDVKPQFCINDVFNKWAETENY